MSSSLNGGVFRIGQVGYALKGKADWKHLRSQDAQYSPDPERGPTLRVNWNQPGMKSKTEPGEFVFRTQCVRIERVAEIDASTVASTAASLVAKPMHWGWARFGGVVGAIIGGGVTAAGQLATDANEKAAAKEGKTKAVLVYYRPEGIEAGTCFFFAVAAAPIIDEILGALPTDRIFDYKEPRK